MCVRNVFILECEVLIIACNITLNGSYMKIQFILTVRFVPGIGWLNLRRVTFFYALLKYMYSTDLCALNFGAIILNST